MAAALRFVGLGSGLRHTPEHEERLFVEPVGKMLLRHDLNHRFYEYPGLFLYLLLPAVGVFAPGYPPGPDAYLAARVVVAVFGVASVGLVFLLARRLAGSLAGLGAALLLAVSPMEVQTAHEVRPDVVLETFVLLFLLSLLSLGERARDDAVSGAALGAAAAIKFTGVLLAPSYLLARAFAPGGARRGRLLLAGAVAALMWFAATPYALINATSFLAGAMTQWSYHYTVHAQPLSPTAILAYYAVKIRDGFGPVGCALAVFGLALAARDARRWAAVAAWPLVLLAVLSTAQARYGRLALSSLGVLAALAGLSLAEAERRWPRAWTLLALAAAAMPLAASLQFVRAAWLPSTLDEVVDWTSSRLPARARILTGVAELGLDRRRFEVLRSAGERDLDELLVRHSDYVVWPGEDESRLHGLEAVHVAEPALEDSGPRLVVARVPPALRRAYRDVSLDRAQTDASFDPAGFAALLAGTPGAAWQTPGFQGPGDWIEIRLAQPAVLGRITLELGRRARWPGRSLQVLEAQDGKQWRPIRVVEARAPLPEQFMLGRGVRSQALVFEPRTLGRIRIRPGERGPAAWGFAGLRLEAEAPANP